MFIVLEVLDGAGKSTQVDAITQYLNHKNHKTKFIHFPQTTSPIYGELIAKFLRGELGSIEDVNPYLVALLYAGDRGNAKQKIQQWLNDGYTVIADRYVFSNIAFQCAKLSNLQDKERLANWILKTEYEEFNIPKPDLSIFLDVPLSFTKSQLTKTRKGEDRDYLQGGIDIHEANLSFQKEVREVYLNQVAIHNDFKHIDCANSKGDMANPNEIFKKILPLISTIL